MRARRGAIRDEHTTSSWLSVGTAQPKVLKALRRRRELRVGLVHTAYVAVGVGFGSVLPTIDSGPVAAPDAISPLVLGIAGGFISFIALVFSLLFLVVQYGNTTISPRLTLFRDDPVVWHAFGFFIAVFAYTTTAAVRLGTHEGDVTIAVPILAIGLVLVALVVSRALQMRALTLLQFNATMEEIRRRGEQVIEALYTERFTAEDGDAGDVEAEGQVLRWERATTLLRQVDVPRLFAAARQIDGAIELHAMVGEEITRGAVVATVYAAQPIDAADVLTHLATGTDRTFGQDPLLALRLLNDIGNRALSTAANDPATAVQALACVQDLLALVVDRRLDPGVIADDDGRPRLRLCLPTWEDFLRAGVDEIEYYGRDDPTVRVRVRALLVALRDRAPRARRVVLDRRLAAWEDADARHRTGAAGGRSLNR